MPELNRGFVPFAKDEIGNDINVYGWNTISAVKLGETSVTAMINGEPVVFPSKVGDKEYPPVYCPVIDTNINRDGIIKGIWNALSAKGTIIEGGNMDFKGESTPNEVTGMPAIEGSCYIMTESGTIPQKDTLVGDLKVTKNEMVMKTNDGWISFTSHKLCKCEINHDIETQITVGGIDAGTTIASGTPITDVFENIYSKFDAPSVKMTLRVNNENKNIVNMADETQWPISQLSINVWYTQGSKPIKSAKLSVDGLKTGSELIYDYPTHDPEFKPMAIYDLTTGEHSVKDQLSNSNTFSGFVSDGSVNSSSTTDLDVVYPVFYGTINKKTIDTYEDIKIGSDNHRFWKPLPYKSQISTSFKLYPDDDNPHMYACVPEEFGKIVKIIDTNGIIHEIDDLIFKESEVDLIINDKTVKYNTYVLQWRNIGTYDLTFTIEKKD